MNLLSLARLSQRNLWRNKRRTFLTLVAISFGLFLSIFFTGIQDRSFADMIDLSARLGGGHVVLQHPAYQQSPTLNHTVIDGATAQEIIAHTRGIQKVVPRITGQMMLATAAGSYGGYFVAIDPTVETDATLSFMNGVQGQLFKTDTSNSVVLGKRLAKNLGAEIGDKVVFTTMNRHNEIVSGLARLRAVVGTGAPSVDGNLVLLPIQTVRDLLDYRPSEVTQLAIFVEDSRNSSPTRDALRAPLALYGAVLTWNELQPELAGFIAMKVGGARFMELVLLILIAASIFNTLFVSVMERRPEFGIMLAIGWSPGQIFSLVMLESLWLAITGIVAGTLLTLPLYSWMVAHPIDLNGALNGKEIEVAGVGFEPLLKMGIYPENVVIIVVSLIAATLAAGIYPAWRAGRILPVNAIRLV